MQEIELKFQVPARRRDALRAAVATRSARLTRLQAVYADTADGRLAAAGLALRLRREGGDWVQTLKGRGDGLMQRLEHEVRLPKARGVPQLDIGRHAGTAAGEALAKALGDAAGTLQPVYRTDIRRWHRVVTDAGARIEIAHDHGFIIAGRRRLAVDEIEFELLRGPAAALVALAQRWATRFDLWWDVRTKAERGLRLARSLDTVAPTRAADVVLETAMTPVAACRAVLAAVLAQLLPNVAELAAGSATPEHLHQARVALRRLDTTLRTLAPWAALVEDAAALREQWRPLFAALGQARDAQLLRSAWRDRLLALDAPALDWPALDGGAGDAGEVVRGADFTRALLTTLALSLPTAADVAADPAPALETRLPALLQAAWRRAARDARRFATDDPERQHRTRKRLKRLRYLIEFVAALPAARPWRRRLPRLREAVEALGQLNDLHRAELAFRAAAARQPAAWFGAGCAAGLREAATLQALRALRRMQVKR